MSKFKIEHGASKVNFVLLKTNIEDTISNDIDLMANWSSNDRKYLVNELLRFAISQEEDFKKYKASSTATATQATMNSKAVPTSIKTVSEPGAKPDITASSPANRA